MEHKAFVSPRLMDCGCWSTAKYYYEEKETGKKICKNCYLKGIKKEFDAKVLPKMIKAFNSVVKDF